MQCAEEQDEQNKAIFTAIVGKGQFFKTASCQLLVQNVGTKHALPVSVQCFVYDLQTESRLLLHLSQSVRCRLRVQECSDPGMDLCAEGGEIWLEVLCYRLCPPGLMIRVSIHSSGHYWPSASEIRAVCGEGSSAWCEGSQTLYS